MRNWRKLSFERNIFCFKMVTEFTRLKMLFIYLFDVLIDGNVYCKRNLLRFEENVSKLLNFHG